MLTIVTLTSLVIGSAFYFYSKKAAFTKVKSAVKQGSRLAISNFDHFILDRVLDITTLGESPIWKDGDKGTILKLLMATRDSHGYFQSISFFSDENKKLLDSNQLDLGSRFLDKKLLFESKRKSTPIVAFTESQDELYSNANFIFYINETALGPGYLIAQINLQSLFEIFGLRNFLVEESSLNPEIALITPGNRIVYSNKGPRDLQFLKALSNIRSHVQSEPIESFHIFPHQNRIIFAEKGVIKKHLHPRKWLLITSIPEKAIYASTDLVRDQVAAFTLVIIGISTLILFFALDQIFIPVYQLIESIKLINIGQFQVPVNLPKSNDELSQINAGIQEMSVRLDHSIAELNSKSKFVALGEMAAGIAHEINTPLTVIAGRARALRKAIENGENGTDKINDAIERIEKMSDRIGKIVQALRAYARDEQLDNPQSVSINQIIEETLTLCSERCRNNGVDLIVSPVPQDFLVLGHPVQLSQIVLNLVNNAYDATEEETERWIRIHVEERNRDILIQVTNSGEKISAAISEKMFHPFYTTKVTGKGTGLGLSISRSIAQAHKGEVYLDYSAPHTTLVLRLPRYFPRLAE